MSKPTIEEMKEWLDAFYWAYIQFVYPIDEKAAKIANDAIRALILAVEEWQQRIIKLLAMGSFGAKDSWVSLREDIRDFGKEGK